jgi:predicted RNase H-like nuclease
VFSVPCREAVYKSGYKEASATNLEILSKRLSRQSWHICRKIAELDMLLCKEPALRSRVRESHPEVAFHFLNGGSSMLEAKKTGAGIAERLALLTSLDDRIMNCYSEALARYPRKEVSRDDLLDALCLAVTLREIMAHGGFRPGAGVDAAGIEMQIHYFDPSATSAEHISDAGG